MSKFGRCLNCRAKVDYLVYVEIKTTASKYTGEGYFNFEDVSDKIECNWTCPLCGAEVGIEDFFTLEE